MSFHQWHSILLFFHSLKVLYDLVSAYCISLDKLELHTLICIVQSVSTRDITKLETHKWSCSQSAFTLWRLVQGSQVLWQLMHLVTMIWLPLPVCDGHWCGSAIPPPSGSSTTPESDKCLSLCQRASSFQKRPTPSKLEDWRWETNQVLVGPHGFQLIFQFGLTLPCTAMFPIPYSAEIKLLPERQCFYRDFIVILIHTPYCKSSHTHTPFPSD